jgi:hypothetical protein
LAFPSSLALLGYLILHKKNNRKALMNPFGELINVHRTTKEELLPED